MELEGLKELTGATITEKDGAYELTWEDGDFFRIHQDLDRIHFDYLFSQNGQHRLAQLVGTLPAYFREQGITAFVTTSSAANEGMLHVGFVWEGSYLVCPIDEGGRMDQYTAYKRGEGDKPDWFS